ncbi:hypothetical protein U14_05812 [Candidatus Moduliflexus flocculans]|uniref:Uncharacterized protein n=1 Tax=Candidatus Moduliflexus flocculans TaxID=1499966 RepID=A0A081BSZ4_9BACT|nr:hypothetical protein U14_05812 [Candidatus Moduliflexus flocculans]
MFWRDLDGDSDGSGGIKWWSSSNGYWEIRHAVVRNKLSDTSRGPDSSAHNVFCHYIQIKFHIPYGQGHVVVGEFAGYQNAFQSRQLYQWYQTYSHRWLMPEGTPPASQP